MNAGPTRRAPRVSRWVQVRRAVQLLALVAFFVLFSATRTDAGFRTPRLAELMFLFDPLVALAALLSGSVVGLLLVAGFLSLVAPLLVGRAFCGWLCPLGTLLDLVRRLSSPFTRRLHGLTNDSRRPTVAAIARLRFGILVAVAVSFVAGLPLLGVVEPFSILVRGATAVAHASDRTLAWVAKTEPARAAPNLPFAEAGIRFIGAPVRPAEHIAPDLAWSSALVLLAVLLMELIQPRAWCRNFCPTGALLGVMARWSLVRRSPRGTCAGCSACVPVCLAGAFDDRNRLHPSACTLCLSCRVVCPPDIIRFIRQRRKRDETVTDWSRRAFVLAGAAGLAVPAAFGRAGSAPSDPWRLRPPGVAAQGEKRFLDACVRCGECVRVCPTQGLQHVGFQDGLAGLYAPRLVPRRGPCEYGCQACAEVCPTGAIPIAPLLQKQQFRMGIAIHDHRRCLPWSKGGECRVCQEHCPAPGKAIKLRMGRAADGGAVMLPYVDATRCIGCGTCEFVCPVQDASGIRVVALEEVDAMRRELQPVRPGVGWTTAVPARTLAPASP